MSYKLKVPYDKTKRGDLAQLVCLKRALTKGRYGVFFQQRVGKTRVAIDFIGKKISDGCKRALIVCPLCAQNGWRTQIPQYLGDTGFEVQYGVFNRITDDIPKSKFPEILIVTYEKACAMQMPLASWKPEVIVYDECHLLKNRGSNRSRMARTLGQRAKYVLGLTGTPYSNKRYADLYGVFRAINPEVFGTTWKHFEEKYCKKGGYMGYEIVGFKNEKELLQKVAENSMRVTRSSVMSEPEAEDEKVLITLSKSARKDYDAFKTDSVKAFEDGATVTAAMVTTLRTKLQQMAAGHVKLDGDDAKVRVVGNDKIDMLCHVLTNIFDEDVEAKVVIVCRYTQDVRAVAHRMVCSYIDGSVYESRRTAILKKWQESKTGHNNVLVVQEQAMSMGVDLSVAHHMVFFTWGEDSIVHRQVKDRIMGRNQTHSLVHYYYLIAENTVDETMYKLLNEKTTLAEQAANWNRWV